MSFGIRALKKKEDHEITDDKRTYVRNLIVGDSTAAYYALVKLNSRGEQAKILTSKPTTIETVLCDWKNSPQTLRGLENKELFKELFPEVNLGETTETPVFYKDSDFKVFGGRSKPFDLKPGEEYFTDFYTSLNDRDLFSQEEVESLGQLLEKNQFQKVIVEVEKTTPTDLAEPANYKLHLSDHELIECENLYWARGPKELFKLTFDKNSLPDVFHKLVSKIQHRSLLKLRLPLLNKVSEHKVTVFLPQSVTHEWGHFICDFYEGENDISQYANVTCFVDEEEASSEGLAKKIKLAKRVMGRVFDKFEEREDKEQITYLDNAYAINIDDELFDEVKGCETNLHLIGESSPVPPKYHSSQFLVRSMVSVKNHFTS